MGAPSHEAILRTFPQGHGHTLLRITVLQRNAESAKRYTSSSTIDGHEVLGS